MSTPSTRRQLLSALALLALVLASPAPSPATQEASIQEMVETIFGGALPEEHATRIVTDAEERIHYAFHVGRYLDVVEVRAYRIPFGSSEDAGPLLEEGRVEEAFELLIGWMRLDMGARYVSDVGLDGIRDAEVEVGTGHMRDRFHTQFYADHAEADAAYREWLATAVGLIS